MGGNQGLVAGRQGRLDEAMALHKAKERICRAIGDWRGVAAALNNQALILRDPAAALAVHREELRICSAIGDRVGVARSLRNQSLNLECLGQIPQTLGLLADCERAWRALGNKVELAKCLMDQARVVQMQAGEAPRQEALLKYDQAKAVYCAIGDRVGLARCLHGAAYVHHNLGQPEQALVCLDEAQDIFRECQHQNGFEQCLLIRALVLLGWDSRGALEILVPQEARLRASGDDTLLSQVLLIQLPVLLKQDKLEEALAKAIECETLCRKTGHAARLAEALAYQDQIRRHQAAVRP